MDLESQIKSQKLVLDPKPKDSVINKESPAVSQQPDYLIQCLQDGLFFGLDYIKTLFPFEGYSYFLDGDHIFAGQTLLSLNGGKNHKSICSLVSYLSGTYTLARCFSERYFGFSVCAYWTPSFAFNEGEKQALLQAGMILKKAPAEKFLEAQELKNKNDHSRIIYLKLSSANKDQVKSILKNSRQQFELMGDLLPKDWEDFRDFYNIQCVYPLCLQGFFPSLVMKSLPVPG